MEDGFSHDDRKKVTVGTLWTIIGGIFIAAFKAMGFVLRALFGGTQFGLFAIAQNLIELSAYFLIGGVNDAIVYFGAKNVGDVKVGDVGERDTFDKVPAPVIENEDGLYRSMATCLGIPFVVSLVIVAALQIVVPWVYRLVWSQHDPFLIYLIRVLICGLPFLLLSQLATEAMKIFLDFRWQVVVVQIFIPTFSIIMTLALALIWGMGIESMVWSLVAGTVCAVPMALYGLSTKFHLWRIVSYTVRLKFDREVLDFAIPQSLNMLLNLGMVRVDSLMLSGFVSANMVGIYSLVSDLTQLIRLARMAFASVLAPLIARYQAQNNWEGMRSALHTLTRYTVALSIPLLITMMVMYPHFVLSAEESWEFDRIFPWLLSLASMMSCFFGLSESLLLMTGRARLLLVNGIVSSLLNVGLNLVLIPWMGLLGAALATAISNTLLAVLQLAELYHLERMTLPPRLYAWILVAASLPVTMAAVVFTPVGQYLMAMMPTHVPIIQAGVYTSIAILFYLVILFLPPGGFDQAPRALLQKLRFTRGE